MPKGEYLQYGGQAIIEGVMMRSPHFFSIACRAPNGDIILQTEALEKTWIGRQKWLKFPFLRGSLALLDSMALGIKAMRFAANIQTDPKYLPADEQSAEVKVASAKIQDATIGVTMLASLAIGLFIFNYLPNLIAEFSQRALNNHNERSINLISELVKFSFFIAYIGLIGQLPDIKEVFKYHGAEHKAINTLEADQPLTMEQCQRQTRLHPRCGTSFAVIVLFIGLIVLTFVPRYPVTGGKQGLPILDVTVRFFIELIILPMIAGVAYELLRLAGKFRNTLLVNILFRPGLWSQYLTTREPRDDQVEVALSALRACIDAEEGYTSDPSPFPNGDARVRV